MDIICCHYSLLVNQARASSRRAVEKKIKICLKYGFSKEHLRDIMKFSGECSKQLLNSFEKYSDKRFKKKRENTTQQRPMSKKAIKAMARELNQMLYHSLKKINMQDLYLECKKFRYEGALPSSYFSTTSGDEYAVQAVDGIMYHCFKEANMLGIYLASKRMKTEELLEEGSEKCAATPEADMEDAKAAAHHQIIFAEQKTHLNIN